MGSDISALAYETASDPSASGAGLNNFLMNTLPSASGTVHFVLTDNDLLAYYQDNPNSNSFGSKEGTLTGTNGTIYKLNFNYRAIWDGYDVSSLKEILSIKLIPTGKKTF